MSTKRPLFVQYCAKDFLIGVIGLSPDAELAYRRLCDLIYATGGPLPDDSYLVDNTRMGRKWARVRAELLASGKVVVEAGRLMVPRCAEELERAQRRIEQCTSAALARHGKAGDKSEITPHFVAPDGSQVSSQDKRLAGADADADGHANRKPYPSESPTESPTEGFPPPPQGARSPGAPLQEAVELWNSLCGDRLGKVLRLTEGRTKLLRARLAEFDDNLDAWAAYCRRVLASPFLTGGGPKGWKADFDWIIRPTNATKVQEGRYDPKPPGMFPVHPPNGPAPRPYYKPPPEKGVVIPPGGRKD